MNWNNKIDKLATPENAKEYSQAGQCRYVFCCDLLEVSIDGFETEQWVNKLEDKFDEILDEILDEALWEQAHANWSLDGGKK